MILEEKLQTYFGFKEFRPGQKEVIVAIFENRDTIGVLPTGTGKSLCYQFSGYFLEGSIIIVSPLLSLMQDQVEQMKAKGVKSVIAINSFLLPEQKKHAIQNLHRFKYIFVSPEMLQTDFVMKKLITMTIGLFVVDEAHCISQWGYDFRTDYAKLGAVRQRLNLPLTLALTATAPGEVVKDISEKLQLSSPVIYQASVDRPNISIKIEQLEDIKEKQQSLLNYVKSLMGPGIIYFSSKRIAEQTADFLKSNGIASVMAYHGGMTHEDRILIQQQFIHGQIEYICATSAFGMGINKDNIRFVIHFHLPLQMESYIQEIGRAGRDGKDSIAILLYTKGDEALSMQLAEGELPHSSQIDRLFSKIIARDKNGDLKSSLSEEERLLSGFSENQWRVTRDFILTNVESNYCLPEIKQMLLNFVRKRKNFKLKKIFEFLELISLTQCRRKAVIHYFGENSRTSLMKNCCDQCGINIKDFESEKVQKNETNSSDDWLWILSKLLSTSNVMKK